MSEPMPEPPEPQPDPQPEPDEPQWTGPTQSEWEATQQQLAQYEQMLQQPQQLYTGMPQTDDFSDIREAFEIMGVSPDRFDQFIGQRTEPLRQFVEQQQIAQGEQQALEVLGEIAARDGEFDRNMAWTMAQHLAATRGAPPQNDRESQQLLAEAAKQIREYERRVGEAYHQAQIQQLQGVADAARTIPATQGGAQTAFSGGYGNVPGAVERRFFGNSG